MKHIITLSLLFLFVMSSYAQKNTFSEKYVKLRQPADENFTVQTFKGKELKQWIDSLKVDKDKNNKEIDFLKKAKQINLIIDLDINEHLSSSQLDSLLQPYEELTSVEKNKMKFELRGTFKKDKIKDLLIVFKDEDDFSFGKFPVAISFFDKTLMAIDISFKKPFTFEEL